MQSLKIDHLQGFCIIDLAFTQSGFGCDFFFPCGMRIFPTRSTSSRAQVPVPPLYRRRFYRQSGRRHFCGVWGGSFCAMESVVIGSVRRRVEGRCSRRSPSRLQSGCGPRHVKCRGVSVAIDGAYMARRKVRIARGTGRRARSGFCQAIPSLLSHLPSCSKCKLQM